MYLAILLASELARISDLAEVLQPQEQTASLETSHPRVGP